MEEQINIFQTLEISLAWLKFDRLAPTQKEMEHVVISWSRQAKGRNQNANILVALYWLYLHPIQIKHCLYNWYPRLLNTVYISVTCCFNSRFLSQVAGTLRCCDAVRVCGLKGDVTYLSPSAPHCLHCKLLQRLFWISRPAITAGECYCPTRVAKCYCWSVHSSHISALIFVNFQGWSNCKHVWGGSWGLCINISN